MQVATRADSNPTVHVLTRLKLSHAVAGRKSALKEGLAPPVRMPAQMTCHPAALVNSGVPVGLATHVAGDLPLRLLLPCARNATLHLSLRPTPTYPYPQVLKSKAEYTALVGGPGPVVVDFYAREWCKGEGVGGRCLEANC